MQEKTYISEYSRSPSFFGARDVAPLGIAEGRPVAPAQRISQNLITGIDAEKGDFKTHVCHPPIGEMDKTHHSGRGRIPLLSPARDASLSVKRDTC